VGKSLFSEARQVDCHIFRKARAHAVSKWAPAELKSWTERSARPDKSIACVKLWSVSYQWCGSKVELIKQIKIRRTSIDSLALFVIASSWFVESLFVDLEIRNAIFRRRRLQ